MSAGTANITIEQGATFAQPVQLKDSSDTARNLSGYTAKAQIRSANRIDLLTDELTGTESTGAGKIAFSKSDVSLPGPDTVTLNLTAAETAAIDANSGIWELQITSSGGVVERILEGSVTINKQLIQTP